MPANRQTMKSPVATTSATAPLPTRAAAAASLAHVDGESTLVECGTGRATPWHKPVSAHTMRTAPAVVPSATKWVPARRAPQVTLAWRRAAASLRHTGPPPPPTPAVARVTRAERSEPSPTGWRTDSCHCDTLPDGQAPTAAWLSRTEVAPPLANAFRSPFTVVSHTDDPSDVHPTTPPPAPADTATTAAAAPVCGGASSGPVPPPLQHTSVVTAPSWRSSRLHSSAPTPGCHAFTAPSVPADSSSEALTGTSATTPPG